MLFLRASFVEHERREVLIRCALEQAPIPWDSLFTILPVHSWILALLRALALAQLAQPTPYQHAQLERLLALAREAPPGLFEALATDWPELRSFIDERARVAAAA